MTVSATAANSLAVPAPSNRTLSITDDEDASTGLTLTVLPDTVSEGATGSDPFTQVNLAGVTGTARYRGIEPAPRLFLPVM